MGAPDGYWLATSRAYLDSPGWLEQEKKDVAALREKERDLTSVILTHPFWSEVAAPERPDARSQLKHALTRGRREPGGGVTVADTPHEPPPITVLLPDGQEVTGRLQERQQVPDAWLYKVAVPAWQNTPEGGVEPAWYVVWVKAPNHVKPVPGVSYDDVPTTRLPLPPAEREILGPRRPSGWVLQELERGRGIIHAVDCEEAPAGAPALTLDKALDVAEHPGTQLCSLCSAATELDPVLKGFGHGFGGED